MEKEFYVVVPYTPGKNDTPSKFQGFFQRIAPKDSVGEIKKRHSAFKQLKQKLSQRVNVVKSGLENCGLRVKELETYELIDFFYKIYNPLTSRNNKFKEIKLTTIATDDEKIKLRSEDVV